MTQIKADKKASDDLCKSTNFARSHLSENKKSGKDKEDKKKRGRFDWFSELYNISDEKIL